MSAENNGLKSTPTRSKKSGSEQEIEKQGKGISHSHVPSDISLRVKALETVLAQKNH